MNRLIIVEGLPCSGKSTTARFIAENTGMSFIDEGTGSHPADYEFHAFLTTAELNDYSLQEREIIVSNGEQKSGGYIVPLSKFSGRLFDSLLQHKIYDFLPWETESPVMLDKWREFADTCEEDRYVFNCVFLQNPMCETMMRFGLEKEVSAEYISEISGIIRPLSPLIVYLKNSEVSESVRKASVERGDEWLNAVIDYHCNGEYGKINNLCGFDGYIAALEERQRRELDILRSLDIESVIINDPQKDWPKACSDILSNIK